MTIRTSYKAKAWEDFYHATMSTRVQNAVLFAARVVFPGESEQPTICSNTEFSRLLRYRLEVIEAALQTLIEIQCMAATTPQAGE